MKRYLLYLVLGTILLLALGCSDSEAEAPGDNLRGFLDYRSPAALWSRFGLQVVDGVAPRPRRGEKLGYSPYRRSVAWQLGDNLLRSGLRKNEAGDSVARSAYAELYLKRKEFERQAAALAGLDVRPAAKIRTGDAARSEGHVHARAKRYVEKRCLLDLWRAWRGC